MRDSTHSLLLELPGTPRGSGARSEPIAVQVERGELEMRVTVGERSFVVDAQPLDDGSWTLLVAPRALTSDTADSTQSNASAGTQAQRLRGGRAIQVHLEDQPPTLTATVDGLVYRIQVADPLTALRERASVTRHAGPVSGRTTVSAPMPGKLVKLMVATGAKVSAGQPLLVMEAMKMENELRAPRDGVVASIAVVAGQTVESGAALLVLE